MVGRGTWDAEGWQKWMSLWEKSQQNLVDSTTKFRSKLVSCLNIFFWVDNLHEPSKICARWVKILEGKCYVGLEMCWWLALLDFFLFGNGVSVATSKVHWRWVVLKSNIFVKSGINYQHSLVHIAAGCFPSIIEIIDNTLWLCCQSYFVCFLF